MNRHWAFLAISIPLTTAAGCGGSTSRGSGGADSGTSSGLDASTLVDAAAFADAGAGRDAAVGPGNVDAANPGAGQDCTYCTAPTAFCCATFGGGGLQSVTCAADSSGCPAGTSGYGCLGPSDCTGGKVCCESGTGSSLGTSCVASCPAANQVCQDGTDCPNVSNCPMNGSRGDVGYGVCTPAPEAGAPMDAGGRVVDASAADASVPADGAPGDGSTDAAGD